MSLIFLHGLGQDSSAWDGVLSSKKYPIEAQCPPLSGLTGDSCTYNSLYDGLKKHLSKTALPIYLCGLSLGAVLALNYAADFPDRVKALVLIAPQFKMPKHLLKLQSVIFRFMPKKAFKSAGFSKRDFISLTGSMTKLDLSSSIRNITCPVLILTGEKDTVNKKAAALLNAAIPNSGYKLIEASGHEVNTDNPEKLAEIIYRFLNSVLH